MNKISLGTAQFGMNYGINNKGGKIPKAEVFDILSKAIEFGIDTIDTAYDYGEGERVIGEFLKAVRYKFKIISKLPECKCDRVKEIFQSSLNNLGLCTIYGYLMHSFDSYKRDAGIWNELEKLKDAGKVEKIGFSLYYPGELEYLLERGVYFDVVQVPFSIFDQRFEPFFLKLRQKNIEIHIRSVFLQGLIFKKSDELDSRFLKIKPKIVILQDISEELNLPVSVLCLGFVLLNNVDKVIIGVDNKENLIDSMTKLKYAGRVNRIYERLKELKEDDENIILPINWK